MKLTKTKLKQIIKEELAETLMSGTQAANAVEQLAAAIKDAYASLPDNETKAQFEERLLGQVNTYAESWRAERAGTAEEGGDLGTMLPRLTPQMHDKNVKIARKGLGTRAHPELGGEGGGVPDWLEEGKKK